MNESLWMYFFMVLGIFGIVIINLFSNVLINNEQTYFLLKEVTEASLYDAVDKVALVEGVKITADTDLESMHCEEGIPGTIRISKEKFVETFIKRLAYSVDLNRNYKVIFHDIDECPPKASVTLIASERFSFVEFFKVNYDSSSANITNSLTGILESKTNWNEEE